MALDLDKGCESPDLNTVRDVFQPLAEHFAPTLTFDPDERFFPVDLPSTARVSNVYYVTGKVVEGREILRPEDFEYYHLVGEAAPGTLQGLSRSYFTSLCNWDKLVNDLAEPPYNMPVPCTPTQLAGRYTGPSAIIDATLTMYATVCRPQEVTNYGLFDFETYQPKNEQVQAALAHGLLVSYYFYFPAVDTPWLQREGDWAGISLLVDRQPRPQHPEDAKPVILCYFKKQRNILSARHWEYFVPGASGFVRPEDVTWFPGPNVNYASSPSVLVSLGRHNCYPGRGPTGSVGSWTIADGSEWNGVPDPEKIEEGTYSLPLLHTSGNIPGQQSWSKEHTYLMLGFSVFALFFIGICPEAEGSPPRPVQKDQTDTNKLGGAVAKPLPSGATPDAGHTTRYQEVVVAGAKPPQIAVVYMDTNDQNLRGYWSYHGSWGAAELEQYPYVLRFKSGQEKEVVIRSGCYGGAWRPNLAAWFMWNLWFDRIYGAGGIL